MCIADLRQNRLSQVRDMGIYELSGLESLGPVWRIRAVWEQKKTPDWGLHDYLEIKEASGGLL